VNRQEQDIILRNNTVLFVRNVQRVLKDMANVEFGVSAKTPLIGLPAVENGMTVITHFSGMIQGDFMFTTDEITAAKIAGVYMHGASRTALTAQRETYAGLMCEVMNVCSHQSIVDLEDMFGVLTLLPPAWVYGEYHMADYISGVGFVSGGCGDIVCSLCLNLVSLQIVDNLLGAAGACR
jgi:CheY-specific phosphatase CheX